jgi:hypothetical protein
LAFIYRRAFGSDPPGYLVESILNDLGALPVRTESLDQAVQDTDLRAGLRAAYFEGLPNDAIWEPEPWQIFRWAIHAGAYGVQSATALAKREGREAWADIDRQYRSEISSAIPETWEDMRDQLGGPDKDGDMDSDIYLWADYFGATDKCVCGTQLVDVYGLADGVVRHYRLRGSKADDAREFLVPAIISAGVEDDESGLCSYCWHTIHKDD